MRDDVVEHMRSVGKTVKGTVVRNDRRSLADSLGNEETSLLEQSPNHNSADNPVSDEEKQQTLVVS